MCARRFLAVIFILILVFVAGAFAIYQFGQQVLVEQATPKGHFQVPSNGGAPAYSDTGFWIARPGMSDNPANWRPGSLQGDAGGGSAAVFYIHPTTYLQRDRWNAPFRADPQTESRTRLFVQSQASAFNDVGQVWAPRYRQAAYGAFLLKSADARKALSFAYEDVELAFDEFLKQNPTGPIVLAAHSQGALHLLRLLQERGSQLKDRIVAAYVVGWPLSTAADLPSLALPACTAADQSGCILSWQSFAEPANPDLVLDAWEGTRGPNGIERKRRDMLCVNPLTGTQNGVAPPLANPGTLVPSMNMTNAVIEPGKVGAHCDRGFLILDGAIPALGPFVLPGNNYHVYDYALFWGAIRDDATRRLRAWQQH